MTRRDDEIIDFDEERSRHAEVYGRGDVIERLKGWLTGEHALARGWVLLLGSPGVGKSAIITRLLDTLPGPTPPHHFIRRGIEKWDRPEVVMQNLCAQIEQRYPDQARADLPAEASLGELLKLLSKNTLVPRGERLVLVIDGLDEIAGDGSGKNPLPLFLPRALPWGVVVLCASRPVHPHLDWLEQRDVIRRIELDDAFWASSNEAACREFWEHHAADFAPPLDQEFIEEAVRRAEGNLLHAIRLCDWLYDQPLGRRVATDIPRGLSRFLEQIWTELQDRPGLHAALVMSGLGVACAAREALPAYLFRELIDGSTPREAEEFLRATRPFLRIDPAHWHQGQPAYRLYHECLREFVAEHLGEHVIRDHHLRLSRTLAAWPADGRDQVRRAYALRHAVAHRIEAGDPRSAEQLCVDVGFLEAKCRDLGVLAVERDLEAVIRALEDDPSPTVTAVLAALSADASRLGVDPSSLPTRLYNRLRCAGWSRQWIEGALRFPKGPPPLRLLHGVRLGPAQLRAFHGHERSVVACAVTPDGRRLISASADRTLRVWALGSGECLATLCAHDDELTACALAPDGMTAVTTSADATARIWDLTSHRVLTTLDNHGRWATACAMTPDGRRVIVGSDNGDITVWEWASWTRAAPLTGHTDYVTACVVTPDGRHLVSASRDQSIRIWSLGSLTCLHVLDRDRADLPATAPGMEEQGWITALALFSRGRRILSASGDGSITQWDLATGRLLGRFGAGQGRVASCAVLHDGRYALCGMSDGTMSVWHLGTERRVLLVPAHAGAVYACAATMDGRRALSASHDRTIKLWELGEPESLAAQDGHAAPVTACAMTPDGRTAVSASEDRTLKVWDVASGTCRHTLEGHADLVTACAISPDGRRVLSGARDGRVRLWHLDAERAEDLEPHAALVSSCAVTPDNRLITASHDGAIEIGGAGRRAAAGQHCAPVDGLALTPDGELALSFSRDGTAKLWDLRARRCERTLRSPDAALLACALTSDGRVVLGRDDGQIEVRDLRGADILRVLRGHEGRIFDCAVSPDGTRVISAGEDETIRVWNLATGESLGTLHGSSWFRCVAVADDRICAGDQEGNLWIIIDDTGGPKQEAASAAPPAPIDATPGRHNTKPEQKLRSVTKDPPKASEPREGGRRRGAAARTAPEKFPTVALANLGNILAGLYETQEDARMLAKIAGLDIRQIDLTGAPTRYWFAILCAARHEGRLQAIVHYVCGIYPDHRALAVAARELGFI